MYQDYLDKNEQSNKDTKEGKLDDLNAYPGFQETEKRRK
jgi:hypothetical protein